MQRFFLKTVLASFFLIPLLSSCGLEQRERELKAKEEALAKKEQELDLRQQAIRDKEAEMLRNDSSINKIAVRNDTLTGVWNIDMTCTESSCPGSAVGDSKKEKWDINYQGQHLVARAISGDQVTRIYTGIFTGNTIELVEQRPVSGAEPATKMVVRVYFKSPTTLEGHREIIRSDCRVMYSVKAEKQVVTP